MTRVFQIGDIVRIRAHSTSEKDQYPLSWNRAMDDWEGLCGMVIAACRKPSNEAEHRYNLLPCPEGFAPKPGDDFRTQMDGKRRQTFGFVGSSLTLVKRSPWRSVPLNGGPLPLVGEWDENTTKQFTQDIRWSRSGVTINYVTVLPSRIPHTNMFTTF